MIPILAGYIAYSIADKPGLVPGMIGGFIARLEVFMTAQAAPVSSAESLPDFWLDTRHLGSKIKSSKSNPADYADYYYSGVCITDCRFSVCVFDRRTCSSNFHIFNGLAGGDERVELDPSGIDFRRDDLI